MSDELITREERAYDKLIEQHYALKGKLAEEQTVSAALRADLAAANAARREWHKVDAERIDALNERVVALEDDLEHTRADLAAAHTELQTAHIQVDALNNQLNIAQGQSYMDSTASRELDRKLAALEAELSELKINHEISVQQAYECGLDEGRAAADVRLRAVKRMKRAAKHWRKMVGEIKMVVVPHISK